MNALSRTLGINADKTVRADQITNVMPRFNPGKEFKRVIDAITFNKN